MQIEKIHKPVLTSFLKIKNIELPASDVIQILEAVIDGPVNDYDIPEDTAIKMVELGYLDTKYGSRQAKLYFAKNKQLCGELYHFLFSDEPVLYIKNLPQGE